MELLLDTPTLIWWLAGDARVPAHVRDAIRPEPSAGLRERRFRLGDRDQGADRQTAWGAAIAGDILRMVQNEGFKPLSVTIEHGQRAGALPGPLRDPFDRMLIAQAILGHLHLISIEHAFDAYGVLRL